jgi:hypothetical protein
MISGKESDLAKCQVHMEFAHPAEYAHPLQ